MTRVHPGRCFCGAVQIEVEGGAIEMGYCHCGDCRAWSGAPITAFTLWRNEQVRVVRGAEHLAGFNKSGFSDRRYCTRCGGHLFVHHPTLGLTDVHAAVLPSLDFKPTVHLNYAATVLPMKDGLPKLADFPAATGGSGATIPE